MTYKYVIAYMLIGSIASSAQAAILRNINGTVMVNRGDGFFEVSGVATVNSGDSVLVRGKGGVQIDYGDDCVVEVLSNQSALVSSSKSCEESSAYSTLINSTGSLKDAPAVYPTEEGVDSQLHVVGGLVVAAGVAAIAFQRSDDKPASP